MIDTWLCRFEWGFHNYFQSISLKFWIFKLSSVKSMVSEVYGCFLLHWKGKTWFIYESSITLIGRGGAGEGSTRFSACIFQNALKAILRMVITELRYLEEASSGCKVVSRWQLSKNYMKTVYVSKKQSQYFCWAFVYGVRAYYFLRSIAVP